MPSYARPLKRPEKVRGNRSMLLGRSEPGSSAERAIMRLRDRRQVRFLFGSMPLQSTGKYLVAVASPWFFAPFHPRRTPRSIHEQRCIIQC
jgi:hypothetical protein